MIAKENYEKKRGENLSLEKISEETEIAYSTIHRWANNYVTRYDSVVLVRLCEYFGVQLSDLIEYSSN